MTWLDGFSDPKTARQRAETAFYAPLGMMSPLWIVFGAAASAGAAFWLMSRLAKPVNIEALMAASPKVAIVPEAVIVPEAAIASEAVIVEVAPPALVSDDVVVETVAFSLVEEPVVEEPELEVVMADDLTQLAGVGPKIAQALAERGVERFEQLAAWTEADLAAFDAALDLRGRAIRAGFVEQARKLAAGEA